MKEDLWKFIRQTSSGFRVKIRIWTDWKTVLV